MSKLLILQKLHVFNQNTKSKGTAEKVADLHI